MKLIKTPIGGLFSAIFLVLALALILSNLLTYFVDNVVENKALIPFLVMKETYSTVIADIYLIVKFNNYQGFCQKLDNPDRDECQESISVESNGFFLKAYEGYWEGLTCKMWEKACLVKTSCKQCMIKSSAYVQFNLEEENSYSSFIEFNVSSTSSIPNEVSSMNMTISPDSEMLFRGTDPTILEIIAISSAFETNNPKEKEHDGDTGYHMMSTGKLTKGSQFPSSEVQFSTNLRARVSFTLSESSLMTRQTIKTSPILLISAILGSVFGIMGALGGAMSFIEKKKMAFDEKNAKAEKNQANMKIDKQINLLRNIQSIEPQINNQKNKKRKKIFSLRKLLKHQQLVAQGVINDIPQKIEDIYEDVPEHNSPFEMNFQRLKENFINNQNLSKAQSPLLKLSIFSSSSKDNFVTKEAGSQTANHQDKNTSKEKKDSYNQEINPVGSMYLTTEV